MGTVAGTIVVARASRRSKRQENRDDFQVLQGEMRTQKAEAQQQTAELRTEVQHVRAEIAEERAGRAEDRRVCEEERLLWQRKIDAFIRLVSLYAGQMRAHGTPIPEVPPRVKERLEEYDLPGV